MPRRRFRPTDPLVRDRNQLEILGAPGLAGLSRVGGRPGGTGGSNIVIRGGQGPGTQIEHVTLSATASQTIASGGAGVEWSQLAGAPTEIRGFDTLQQELSSTGAVVAIPCDLTGRLMVGLELQFLDATTGVALDETGVDCTLQLERVRDGVTTTMPGLLEDTDLVGITGWMAGWVRAGDFLNVKLTTSADIQLNGQVTVDIDGTGSPTSAAQQWTQVLSADVYSLTFLNGEWWTTEGLGGLTVTRYDTDWTALGSFEASFPASLVRGITTDGTDLWIVGGGASGGDYIRKFDTAGTQLASFQPGDGSVNGLTYDGTNLWAMLGAADVIAEYDTAGASQGSFAVPGSTSGLSWYAGRLFAVDNAAGTVTVYDTDGTVVDTIDVSGATSTPTGVYIATDGTMYVSEDGVGVWRRG